MKNHFQRLRKLTLLSSTIAPFFIFLAFICAARDSLVWAVIPLSIAFLLLLSFPTEVRAPAAPTKSEWRYGLWIRMFGSWLLIFWILAQPGASDLISRLISSEALWDWRIILAVFIWCLNMSITNFRTASSLEDVEILAIYDDSERDRIMRQAEQGVTPNA
jgi:hypothetical protein